MTPASLARSAVAPSVADGARLYLCELSDPHGSEVFYKIGMTRHAASAPGAGTDPSAPGARASRLETIRHALARTHGQRIQPYQSAVLAERVFADETEAFALERDLREATSIVHYRPLKPFSGEAGCFACERPIVEMIANYIEEA